MKMRWLALVGVLLAVAASGPAGAQTPAVTPCATPVGVSAISPPITLSATTAQAITAPFQLKVGTATFHLDTIGALTASLYQFPGGVQVPALFNTTSPIVGDATATIEQDGIYVLVVQATNSWTITVTQ